MFSVNTCPHAGVCPHLPKEPGEYWLHRESPPFMMLLLSLVRSQFAAGSLIVHPTGIVLRESQDVDQRITRDVERLAGDMAALVPTMVKPVVDILWFSTRLWALTGRRGMAVLYIYAALGFGCLR